MAKKNKMTQIMAFLALFGIVIGVVGTGILVFFSGDNNYSNEQELTPEQYAELLKAYSGALIETGTGTETLTGETK